MLKSNRISGSFLSLSFILLAIPAGAQPRSAPAEIARDALSRAVASPEREGRDQAMPRSIDWTISSPVLRTLEQSLGATASDANWILQGFRTEPSDSVARCQATERSAAMCTHITPRILHSLVSADQPKVGQVVVEVLTRRWRGPSALVTGSSTTRLLYERRTDGTWAFVRSLGGKVG